MKLKGKIVSGLLALGMMASGLVGCADNNKELLYGKYNYDLSNYIELGIYKGVEAMSYEKSEITDERVQLEINSVLYTYAKVTSLKGKGAEMGNSVSVDYLGTSEGAANLVGRDVEFVLGTGAIYEAIDQALVGHCAGEEVSVDVTYPEDHEYAGRTVHYELLLKKVQRVELPMYTDDFVRGYLGYDSVEAYEEAVRQKLIEDSEESYMSYLVNQTWTKVVENTNVITYPAELDETCEATVEAHRAYAAQQGITFASYLGAFYQMTEEEYLAAVVEDAKTVIKEEMVIYAIARAENITLPEDEYVKRATEYATEVYGYETLEEFEENMTKDVIRRTILGDLVREFVANNAKLTQGSGIVVGF